MLTHAHQWELSRKEAVELQKKLAGEVGPEESTATRKAGGVNFRPSAEKAKSLQCFYVELATRCKAPGLLARIDL